MPWATASFRSRRLRRCGCSSRVARASRRSPTRRAAPRRRSRHDRRYVARGGLPAKSLLGIPWRVAFALQADGWILRNAIILHKPNAMPESARDRASSRHEYVFLLVKQARYWFDLDAIREPLSRPEVAAHPPPVGGRQRATGCIGGSARRRSGRSHGDRKYH